MIRWVIALLLACCGILLAQDLFGAHGRLYELTGRNPATIAFTEFAYEKLPEPIYLFEQDCLRHLYLMPYFVAGGIIAGFFLSARTAVVGVSLPLAYIAWSSFLLLRMASGIENLHWSVFIRT